MRGDAFAQQTLTEVERVETLDAERFVSTYLHQKPVVLTGVARGWPAVGKWTPSWFREACGDTVVVARQYLNDGRPFLQQAMTRKRRVTLAQWIAFLEGDASVPLDGEPFTWSLRESKELFWLHRELRKDARFDELFPSLGARFDPFLWFGPPGYVTGLHTDIIDLNLLLHLHGEKEVLLYAPDETDRMYPEALVVQGGLYSLVNAYAPDLARHPRFAHAVGQRTTLSPGEILYVPNGWWHMVRSHDVTISLTASCARLPAGLSTLPSRA